jgi:N-acetylglutamate synthase-like GNAT family acetyltransferase
VPGVILRAPRESDWPAILELANRSVAAVPGAGPQEAWLANRRSFPRSSRVQRQWVADDVATGEVVGYAALESEADDPASFRLFVVTDPSRRAALGGRLLHRALSELGKLEARQAFFIEYARDTEFLVFLSRHGFARKDQLELPEGGTAVVLTRSLAAPTRRA